MSQLEIRKAEEYYHTAELLKETNPTESLCLFQRAIFLSPEYWKWYYGRASTYLSMGEISSALLNAKKAHYLNRSDVKTRKLLCLLYDMDGLRDLQRRHVDLCLEKFSTCLRYEQNYAPALLHRGTVRLFFKPDELYQGLKDIEECKKMKKCYPHANVILGQYYLSKDDLSKASIELEECLKDEKYNGEVLEFKKKFEECLEEKKEILRKKVSKKKHLVEECLDLANKLIVLRPADFEIYFMRGLILKAIGNYGEAIKDYMMCNKNGYEKETSKILLHTCMILLSQEYYEKDIGKCIYFTSEAIESLRNELEEYMDTENPVEVFEDEEKKKFKLFIIKNYILRGDSYLQRGKFKNAQDDYKKALMFDDVSFVVKGRLSHVHLKFGKALVERGRVVEGEIEFGKSIEYDRSNIEAYLFRAKIRLQDDRTREAVDDLAAYYLVNNQNLSVNKLVYKYIPQLVYSSQIQKHYRKKFNLPSFHEIRRKKQEIVDSENHFRFSFFLGDRKYGDVDDLHHHDDFSSSSSPPGSSSSFRATSAPPYRRRKVGNLEQSANTQFGSSSKRKRKKKNQKNQKNKNHSKLSSPRAIFSSRVSIEKPFVEFSPSGVKFPELHNSTFLNSEKTRNLELHHHKIKNKSRLFPHSTLPVRELRKYTKNSKMSDKKHKVELERIRNQPISKSDTDSAIRRIKEREKKVLNISTILKSDQQDEDEDDGIIEGSTTRLLVGDNPKNAVTSRASTSSSKADFFHWKTSQREYYSKKYPKRIQINQIGRKKKRRGFNRSLNFIRGI